MPAQSSSTWLCASIMAAAALLVSSVTGRQRNMAFAGTCMELPSIRTQPRLHVRGFSPKRSFVGGNTSSSYMWSQLLTSFAGAFSFRVLCRLRGYAREAAYSMEDARERNRQREAEAFFSYRRRLVKKGFRPRSVARLKRSQESLFQSAHVTPGIDFDKYDEITVECTGGSGKEQPVETFEDIIANYEIPNGLRDNMERCGYDKPTPVQKYSIPAALCGTDCLVTAQTGSGKTAAFLVPLITTVLNADQKELTDGAVHPTAVVLSPTRELCQQIAMEAQRLTFGTRCGITCIYGGADAGPQLESLAEGGDIVVCTPGRLDDFLDRGVISMNEVRYLVLDEADRMLDMGFEPQIRNIIEAYGMPQPGHPDLGGRQTMLFSATFPDEVKDLALDYLEHTYMQISVGRVGSVASSIEQRFEDASGMNSFQRIQLLVDTLRSEANRIGDVSTAIVFVNMKQTAENVAWELNNSGIASVAIHGGLLQHQRDDAIKKIKNGRLKCLVATDVAARGLDLPGVDHVVNFELPRRADDYTHRIGRTGRIGNTGVSTSFVGTMEPALKEILLALEDLGDEGQDVPKWLHQRSKSSRAMMQAGRYGRPDRNNLRPRNRFKSPV